MNCVKEESLASVVEDRIHIPFVLLAKSLAIDWKIRGQSVRLSNCYGCSIGADRSKHESWCEKGISAWVYVCYSQFISATDHHHVSRLLKRFLIELDLPLEHSKLLFSREYREDLLRCESHKFQDLIISFLLCQCPQRFEPVREGEGTESHQEIVAPLHAR